jgi:hypothetical protein
MQKVVGSNPISRLIFSGRGALAEWLRSGLQSRLHRFDSGRRLSECPANQGLLRLMGTANRKACPEYVPKSVRSCAYAGLQWRFR